MRAAPLPSAEGGCCCWVPVMWPQGLCNFWVGVPPPLRRRPPPSRHVPLVARQRVRTSEGVAPSPARPAPGASPSWVGHGAGAASITADSPTRKGHPARRPSAGRRAGPTIPSWGLEGRGNPSATGSFHPRDPRREASNQHHARLFCKTHEQALRTAAQQETQPSQFKRPKDLHEDRRVSDVHIVSCGLRLPVPSLKEEHRFVNSSLNGGRQPPFARRGLDSTPSATLRT